MKACAERELWLHGLMDGELDAANRVEMEAHLKTCPGCAAELRRMEAIRADLAAPELRLRAPLALRNRIVASLDGTTVSSAAPRLGQVQQRGPSRGPWLVGGALAALAASLALFFGAPALTTRNLQDQLISSHVRSLLASHLTDVATSNQHVVKPWFNGRIDFAPPVVDLAEQGFPLVGGRLDYVDGRVVPALVYQRRLHTINLFIRPAGSLSSPVGITTRRSGYSLIRWTKDGLEFWAVSDLEPADLQIFQRDFSDRSTS